MEMVTLKKKKHLSRALLGHKELVQKRETWAEKTMGEKAKVTDLSYIPKLEVW